MLPYWLLFAYFTAGAVLSGPGARGRVLTRLFLGVGAIVITLMIGLRYEVGGDWANYVRIFRLAEFNRLGALGGLQAGDPGYQLLNWLVLEVGAGLWLVNLVCAAIFTWGLFKLARIQPDPWLAILVAVPYLVIVVAMGFTRQAVALGILMAAVASLERGASSLRFAAYVAVAALFHRTAVFVIPLAVLASRRNNVLMLVGIAATAILLFDLLLAGSVDFLFRYYIEAEYGAEGAFVRVMMSLVPAALFLLRQRSFGFDERERKIWQYFSFAAFAFFALLFALPSSAAIDRLALYITPLQIVILSRVPTAYGAVMLGRFLIIAYAFAVQYVWLNYAVHAPAWLPYQTYPLFG